MAHECPECGQVCYCGNDIDDMLLIDSDSEIRCTHFMRCEQGKGYNEEEPELEGE